MTLLSLLLIIAGAWLVLGLCWYGSNRGAPPAPRSRRAQPVPPRHEQPAPEPWLTADEVVQAAREQAERDIAGLRAGANWIMRHLSRDWTER